MTGRCVEGTGCVAEQGDCPLYWASGVQQQVPENRLDGWALCHNDRYSDGSALDGILSNCSKAKLLLACRPWASRASRSWRWRPAKMCSSTVALRPTVRSSRMELAGITARPIPGGSRPVATTWTGASATSTTAGKSIRALRMCWHTEEGALNTGYRCGDNNLNGNAAWERVIYQAD